MVQRLFRRTVAVIIMVCFPQRRNANIPFRMLLEHDGNKLRAFRLYRDSLGPVHPRHANLRPLVRTQGSSTQRLALRSSASRDTGRRAYCTELKCETDPAS